MEENQNFEDELFESRDVKRPGLMVLLGGIATTFVTMFLLFMQRKMFPNFELMGQYANYIIPVGAIVVGICAGSGYGLASWLTGSKIGRGLLFQVVILQVIGYFAAQYVEYFMLQQQAGGMLAFSFWEYFDFITRAFAWDNDGNPGEPFGTWGYGMRVLEISGFSLSGLLAPALLFAVPYCEKCQVYMRSKDIGLLPAGILPRKIKKKDTEGQKEYEQEQKQTLEQGQELANQLIGTIKSNKAQDFVKLLNAHAENKKEVEKQTSRLKVSLEDCRRCQAGKLAIKLLTGQGDTVSSTDFAEADLDADFIRDIAHYQQEEQF